MVAVADELEDARDELEDREHAILQVRQEMQDLVRQLSEGAEPADAHDDDPYLL
ncbi:hypothetical protein CONPUDRAFT_88352 [Coniophora puteana RWD-64-598 SS2]|uniref:Uncharacterized protein n=1 Tax=Coniophora puteana (strain RWD-64-598) TaxID=741705 RepID=A0A5M3MY69_CONPW|nr:uncharacterized protein CONPUDRAFT_88352 [Coniophora puteana RWD-64-598 SS2]EIW83986.1 hypothetical protein CONPUDRAFT_88352 [Coniophora puteana RWD-64-598 SS2]